MMLSPRCPSGGPMGGDGSPAPAGTCSFRYPVTFFAMRYSFVVPDDPELHRTVVRFDGRLAIIPLLPRHSRRGTAAPLSSCPDLIRASIPLHNKLLAKMMDCRAKPGNDKTL